MMKKAEWTAVNLLWIVTYVFLTGWTFHLESYSYGTIPIVLIFLYILARAFNRFDSAWVVWLLPYVFASISYVWLFVRTNFFSFLFKGFWLSISKWLTPPVSPEISLFLLMFSFFPVICAISVNLKRNGASVFMMTASIVMGITAQYLNPFASVGFVFLFVLSVVMRSRRFQKSVSDSSKRLFLMAAIPAVSLILLSMVVKPVSVAGNFFDQKGNTATPTRIARNLSAGSEQGQLLRTPVSGKRIVLGGNEEGWAIEALVDIVGVTILIIAGGSLVLMVMMRRKRKRNLKTVKKILLITWSVVTVYFVLFFALAIFHSAIPDRTGTGTRTTRTFVSQEVNNAPSNPSKNPEHAEGKIDLSDPLFWFAAALAVIATIFYTVLKNKGFPISAIKSEKIVNAESSGSKKDETIHDFSGTSKETVFFYYRLLRSEIGDPTETPYEFLKRLEKLVDVVTAKKLTEIFVKLRYAHAVITEEDAKFVKMAVVNLLS